MYSRNLLKVAFLPAATVVVQGKSTEDKQEKPQICRASELPIYVPAQPAPPSQTKESDSLALPVPTILEETIGTIRQQCSSVYKEVKAYKSVGVNYIAQTKDNADWLLKYLRKEDNVTPKAGAIAIGGLTGLIFGLRGRFIKRTVYTTAGALTMAAICYPQEASEYSEIAISETRKYATIAYNFVYGVKKDDPPLELPSLPKLPSSLSEAWDTVSKSASSLVSGGETEQVCECHGAELSESDAIAIITQAHEESSKSCHCPVGACLGHHEERA